MRGMTSRPESRRSLADRDEWYRQQCDEIAYRDGMRIRAEGGVAYLETANGSTELCRPGRKFWYEVWLTLKYRRPAPGRETGG